MQKQKRITLNAEKRKVIADVFQNSFEDNSKYKEQHTDAINTYCKLRTEAKTRMNNLVRFHQPQEDVDTIRGMINKYGERNGGELYEDSCFYIQKDTPTIEKDYEGNDKEVYDDVYIKFGDMDKDFLTSYYRDEMKAKGIDADFNVRLGDNYDKRNPTYYNAESEVNKYLGFGTRNNVSRDQSYHKDNWDNDFKLWVIGTSYCHSRKFKADQETFNFFKMFKVAEENVVVAHKNLFDHVNKKMEKLKLGLKSYRYFDQAKELADKLGIPLNESILNESSSLALSIYSPTNLADLLTDEVEQTKEEKIAIAKKLLAEQVNSLN
tara:strand:+ start:294 stop:1259 length:966 start_codon:yes stop_codon:yes gene_type:complete